MTSLSVETFRSVDANPGATLQLFVRYTERIALMFDLVFRKADGTAFNPSDREKKSMLLFKGGDDMKNLFQYVGKVEDGDSYEQAIEKIKKGLSDRTNKVVQRNLLLADFPQGSKSFEKWSQEISNTAKLISYDAYDWKQAAVDAILLQTSSARLRERALQENTSYEDLMKMGIAKEQSARGAALLEHASSAPGPSNARVKAEEEVRRLQHENQKLRSRRDDSCGRCGRNSCPQGNKCPANGQKCHKCGKENHFSKVCRIPGRNKQSNSKAKSKQTTPRKGRKKRHSFGQLSSAEESESEESSGRIVVGQLSAKTICAKVDVCGTQSPDNDKCIELATDTGISKTLLNRNDWEKIKDTCQFVKTSKRFRPYGTAYHLPIKGKAQVTLTAERGATINTWVYIVDDKREQSLLGEGDAIRLGIVKLDLKGADTEVVKKMEYTRKANRSPGDIVSGGETQAEIDENMKLLRQEFPNLFTDKTGKCKGPPIKIQVRKGAVPVIQPQRRIPLHYMERLEGELKKMLDEDIIEGPIDVEEPGTFISNLVITDKSDTDQIRVTLDCQVVNKEIYPTHEPIPSSEELRHDLLGSDRFSKLDMTNCYFQFEIEERARKLYAFRSPWGIYRYKRMVMGTSPASSEIQKKIRKIIQGLPNAIHIKDDIVIHGIGKEHDEHLKKVLVALQEHGITLRPAKCELGQPEVKWFGQIYSKQGVSPDPAKCEIIKNWPAPTSNSEVKSFLQTVQFNAKFLGGEPGQRSYPELTEPLRALTKKYARFRWGRREDEAFKELKERLCSEKVLAPYDLSKKTRLYVDSSPTGTQAMVGQLHIIDGEECWRPVNHTSRAWTTAEAGYGQVERESNGILTGMCMNRMYTLGTHVEVVTDHEPLIALYDAASNPKQLRVDRHRTKLLTYSYHVTYEAGSKTPCDYGSRHPPNQVFSQEEIDDWCIEQGNDIYVNRVIDESLPSAITMAMVRQETSIDSAMQGLMRCITSHNKQRCEKEYREFSNVFDDLTVIDGVIIKGGQVVIPESLRAEVIGLAHEGHQYAEKTLSLLRQSCWFPRMRKDVLDYVESCIPCLSAISRVTPVPLQPNMLPERAWQNLHADFKGPIAGSYYLHVVIDQYSKYPEVDVVTSTSFKKLRPRLDRIFSGHGIPETVTADNGPPYPSNDMKEYAKEMGFRMTPVTPEDPQSNGFAEVFVKVLCKLLHTAAAEGKDPRREVEKYLLQYRATPHPTTGKSPAEMLYNRKIRTKLPQWFPNEESKETKGARKMHDEKRMVQKHQFDRRRNAKEKIVHPGDQILIRQKKTTTAPPFDPKPYVVTDVDGNRVHANRDGRQRRRDKNDIKVVKKRPDHLVPSWQKNGASKAVTCYDELDIETNWSTPVPDEELAHGVLDVASASLIETAQPIQDSNPELPDGGAVTSGSNTEPMPQQADELNVGTVQPTQEYSSPEMPSLKKGDIVRFRGKNNDDEWFTCKLVSRAGKAKGKYRYAWNVVREDIQENIDFQRDAGFYHVVGVAGSSAGEQETVDVAAGRSSEEPDNEAPIQDMEAHIRRLIEAAELRELGDSGEK